MAIVQFSVAAAFLMFMIFPANAALPSIVGSDLIEHTCQQTPYHDVCVWSLISHQRSFNTDVKGLAEIMVHTINARATNTLHQIRQLLEQEQEDSDMKQALDYCASRYNSIIKRDVPRSLKALRSGDRDSAERGAIQAASKAKSCEEEFESQSQSPLANLNRAVHHVSIVAASVAKQVSSSSSAVGE